MRRWALVSASLKVNSTDTTNDPRALCFRVSPATWFASFPAKRGGEDALSAQRMSRKKTVVPKKTLRKGRTPHCGEGRVSADARCRLDRRSGANQVCLATTRPCAAITPGACDGPVELSHRVGEGSRGTKI